MHDISPTSCASEDVRSSTFQEQISETVPRSSSETVFCRRLPTQHKPALEAACSDKTAPTVDRVSRSISTVRG
jgi:hypothetical protein